MHSIYSGDTYLSRLAPYFSVGELLSERKEKEPTDSNEETVIDAAAYIHSVLLRKGKQYGKVGKVRDVESFSKLVSEALNGEYPMEKLPSPAYDFAEERQAVYYSKMRYNMESDMSVMVMKHHQQLTELES